MLIDPFTVIAQIINFALLIWLLRRFLYGPVTRAMEAREARIREEVESARRLRAEAEAEGARYKALLADLESQRDARLLAVQTEAEAHRQATIREARAEVSELRERWRRALEEEKETFLRELRVHVARESLDVMRRALKELADADLESRFIRRFLDRLGAMDADDRARLTAAARAGDELRIRTAFPLSGAHRASLAGGIGEVLGVELAPRFETDPDLVAGVELRAGDLVVAWTLDEYLDAFERALRDAIDEPIQPRSVEAGSVDPEPAEPVATGVTDEHR